MRNGRCLAIATINYFQSAKHFAPGRIDNIWQTRSLVFNELNTKSEFTPSFFQLLKINLKNIYLKDIERLRKRLSLREDNVCVIGFPLQDKLDAEVRNRIFTK